MGGRGASSSRAGGAASWSAPSMPTLQGSDRQTSWAEDIRDTVVTGLTNGIRTARTPGEREVYQGAVDEAATHSDAKYWIDGRNGNLGGNLISAHLNRSLKGNSTEGRVVKGDHAARIDYDTSGGRFRVDYTQRRPETMRLRSEPQYDYRSRPIWYSSRAQAVRDAKTWLSGRTPRRMSEEYD